MLSWKYTSGNMMRPSLVESYDYQGSVEQGALERLLPHLEEVLAAAVGGCVTTGA
ncbi:hypothetical protein BGS_0866 [Beggiatoa sp. SS]|nr:hypothetical protein BGS_0866 [Beggiatoa sp. SS]